MSECQTARTNARDCIVDLNGFFYVYILFHVIPQQLPYYKVLQESCGETSKLPGNAHSHTGQRHFGLKIIQLDFCLFFQDVPPLIQELKSG